MRSPARRARLGRHALVVLGIVGSLHPPALAAQEHRVDLDGLGWAAGPAGAPIQVIEFTDPSCPYCARFHGEARDSLFRDFVEPGHARWVTIPWVSGLFPNSAVAARALACVNEDESEALLTALYRVRSEWTGGGASDARQVILRTVSGMNESTGGIEGCLDGDQAERVVERARRVGTELGVRGTPTYFVNGFPMMGAVPYGFVRRIFDQALDEGPPAPHR